MNSAADVIIVGAGLAGLVAATELVNAGRRVLILDQEPEASLGGQAFWFFGGLFFVNSPQQRWLGIRDSCELAWQDWLSTASFDREEDYWPRQWAQAYVAFAAGEKYAWLHSVSSTLLRTRSGESIVPSHSCAPTNCMNCWNPRARARRKASSKMR